MNKAVLSIFSLLLLVSSLTFAQNRGDIFLPIPIPAPGKVFTVDEVKDAITEKADELNVSPIVLTLLTSDLEFAIKLYKVIYWTIDLQGKPALASGLIVIPQNAPCLDMMVYHHGTIYDDKVPSNLEGLEFAIGLLYGAKGFYTILPDYLGSGDDPFPVPTPTVPLLHPYLEKDTEASATVDLMLAAKGFAQVMGLPLTGKALLGGYSQGAHAGMSTHWLLQQSPPPQLNLRVKTAGLGSGPYDLSGSQLEYIEANDLYPGEELLFTIASCKEQGYPVYTDGNPGDILQPAYVEPFETNIIGQTGNLIWIPDNYNDLFLPGAFGQITMEGGALHQCAFDNNVYDWSNRKPTTMYYCQGDTRVDPQNSFVAEQRFEAKLPWYLFWLRYFINTANLGNADHNECAIPYVLFSKIQFDLNQSSCLHLRSQEEVIAADRFIVRPTNYFITEIVFPALNEPVVKIDFLYIDGTLAQTFTSWQEEEGRLLIPTAELRRGAYLLEITTATGEKHYAATLLEQVKPLTHPDYHPLRFLSGQEVFELDLSLLKQEVTALYIYDQQRNKVMQFKDLGRSDGFQFSMDGLLPGEYLLEVRSGIYSYFLELDWTGSAKEREQALVYPNPSDGQLTVKLESGETIFSLRVIDVQGRVLWSGEGLHSSKFTTPMIDLPNGTYQIQITTESGQMINQPVVIIK